MPSSPSSLPDYTFTPSSSPPSLITPSLPHHPLPPSPPPSLITPSLPHNPLSHRPLASSQDASMYDAIQELHYLDMVVQESLRVYPPLPRYWTPLLIKMHSVNPPCKHYCVHYRTSRQAQKTIEISGVTIPKGTVVTISIYQIHHNPEFWTDPEKFDPERYGLFFVLPTCYPPTRTPYTSSLLPSIPTSFPPTSFSDIPVYSSPFFLPHFLSCLLPPSFVRFTPEEKAKRPNVCHMPFGWGPRNCIGMRFALMEAKMALIEILRKYTFVRAPETEVSSPAVHFNNILSVISSGPARATQLSALAINIEST